MDYPHDFDCDRFSGTDCVGAVDGAHAAGSGEDGDLEAIVDEPACVHNRCRYISTTVLLN
ncbi:MAG: hypothetical protein EXR75_15320 [Myxococcales bacterium]|nr:hypothetical protein [Myxococcales bacterium]